MIVVAVVVAMTCVGLGFWQLARLADRRALNARILGRASAPPVTIEGAEANSVAYRPAIAEGTYDVADEVLLYGRSLDGEAGHHIVTPLVLANGDTVLVVRGWVPFANQSAPVRDATPPPGEVRVRGVLVPDEGDGSAVPDASGVIRTLDVAGIGTTLPSDLFPLPLQLTEQVPPQPGDLPMPVPLPELSEGSHLSYAIQWFAFAVVAVAGAAILVRRDADASRRAPTADP
ncbi:MAG: SURF1 family protein [Actinomycetota bacterium]